MDRDRRASLCAIEKDDLDKNAASGLTKSIPCEFPQVIVCEHSIGLFILLSCIDYVVCIFVPKSSNTK